MDNNTFDAFADLLSGMGLEPFEDDIESQATDFDAGHGLDPERFHDGFLRYLAG